jgi:hypothetical protein
MSNESNAADDGDAATKQRVTDLLSRPENANCADCNAPSPKYVLTSASWTDADTDWHTHFLSNPDGVTREFFPT